VTLLPPLKDSPSIKRRFGMAAWIAALARLKRRQVNCGQQFDMLLAEIVRIKK
jgi:hypothetical protein